MAQGFCSPLPDHVEMMIVYGNTGAENDERDTVAVMQIASVRVLLPMVMMTIMMLVLAMIVRVMS